MRFLLIIGCLVLFQGCSSQEPRTMIAEEALIPLLAELHIADSRMLLDSTAPDSLRIIILREHGVTEEQLDGALRYLSDNPEYMAAIYSQVVDRIVESSD
ncbi:MAG: DUF4296 domain-containing protein [Rhodothermales bacterium]|nr:DUF4296 domain-containing protein [Rhodothermales bacterium]